MLFESAQQRLPGDGLLRFARGDHSHSMCVVADQLADRFCARLGDRQPLNGGFKFGTRFVGPACAVAQQLIKSMQVANEPGHLGIV